MGFLGSALRHEMYEESEHEDKIKNLQSIETQISSEKYIENTEQIKKIIEANADFNPACELWAKLHIDLIDINKVHLYMFMNLPDYKILSNKKKEWIQSLYEKLEKCSLNSSSLRRSQRIKEQRNKK